MTSVSYFHSWRGVSSSRPARTISRRTPTLCSLSWSTTGQGSWSNLTQQYFQKASASSGRFLFINNLNVFQSRAVFHCQVWGSSTCLAIQPRPHISPFRLFSLLLLLSRHPASSSHISVQPKGDDGRHGGAGQPGWWAGWSQLIWKMDNVVGFFSFFYCSYWKPPYSRTTCNAFPSTALSWPQEIAQSIISGISDGKYKYKVIENTSSFINTRSMITQNVSVWTLRELSFKFCRQFPGTKSTLRFVCICVQKSLVEDLAISSVVSDLKHKD